MKQAKTVEEILEERSLRPVKSRARTRQRQVAVASGVPAKPDNLEKILRDRNLKPAASSSAVNSAARNSPGHAPLAVRPEGEKAESVWTRRFRCLVKALARDAGAQWQLGGSCEVCAKYITQGEVERSAGMVGKTLCVRHLIAAIP